MNKLYFLRKKLKMSKGEFAEGLRISRPTYTQYEYGARYLFLTLQSIWNLATYISADEQELALYLMDMDKHTIRIHENIIDADV